MAYIPSSGSVVAFQSNPSALQALVGLQSTNASVITVGSPVANQSVSGTVGSSVIGHAPVVIVGGSILTSSTPNQSVSGAVQLAGISPTSLLTLTRVDNQIIGSMMGMVGQVTIHGVTTLGSGQFSDIRADAGTGAVLSSVVGLQGASVSGTVQAQLLSTNASVITVGSPVANQSVSGTVGASVIGTVPVIQSGTRITSIVSTVPSSVLVGASIFGQLPAGTAVLGSVATLQGTNPWTVSTNGGSVITLWGKSPSIVGTYAEDAAHTSADKGLFVLGVRNDTVSSFTSANGEYNPFAHDSAGRVLNKPFAAGEASVIGINSIVSAGTAASVLLFPAPGAGLKNYVTDWAFSNSGGTTVVALIADTDSSIVGRAIVPTGGGNNATWQTPLVTTRTNTALNLQLIGSSSIVYATVSGYKAP